jgi:eukaryotic-like serine/threonine-protein kinase
MTSAEPSSPEERRAAQRIGTTFGGRWTLERVLGVGGMAAVYAVSDPSGAKAALKLLHPEHAIRPEIRERFLREGMAANRVGHPGAVRVLDSATVESEDTAYLVMELLDGESLGERRARGPLSPDEILDVLDQTLDVLAVAHEQGIVHRDLKPDNLFITKDGRTVI